MYILALSSVAPIGGVNIFLLAESDVTSHSSMPLPLQWVMSSGREYSCRPVASLVTSVLWVDRCSFGS